jgi:hypothetical protein
MGQEVSAEEAERVAVTIIKDRDAALDTMAREELGLDPDQFGAPWWAGQFEAAFVHNGCGRGVAFHVRFRSGGADRRDRVGMRCAVWSRRSDRFDQWSKRLTVRDTSATRWRRHRRGRFPEHHLSGCRRVLAVTTPVSRSDLVRRPGIIQRPRFFWNNSRKPVARRDRAHGPGRKECRRNDAGNRRCSANPRRRRCRITDGSAGGARWACDDTE